MNVPRGAFDDKFLAYLDILGFSTIAAKLPLNKLVDLYAGTVNLANASTSFSDDLRPGFSIVSDCMFVRPPENVDLRIGLQALIHYVSLLLHNSVIFSYGTPDNPVTFRGAISFAKYFHSVDRHSAWSHDHAPIIVGEAIIEALDWERRQNWIGVSLCPESRNRIEQSFPDLLQQLIDANYLTQHLVATKRGLEQLLCVNFVNKNHAGAIQDCLTKLRDQLTDSSAIAKYQSTMKFVADISASGRFAPLDRFTPLF